jgi:cysteine-rich repeat protein
VTPSGTWADTNPSTLRFWTLIEDGGGTITGVAYEPAHPELPQYLSGSRSGVDVSLTYRGIVMTSHMTTCHQIQFSAVGLIPPKIARQRYEYCGDGTIQAPVETCDDGNLTNGDGCDVDCLDPPPASTTSSTSSTSTTTTSTSSPSASTTSTTLDEGLRSFQCYDARSASATTQSAMGLVDTFGSQMVGLTGARAVCAPADEDAHPSGNPAHLTAYQLRAPGFEKVRNRHVETALGEVVVDVVKPQWLLLPSGSSGTPTDPDHFTCYKVKRSRGAAKFVKQTGVGIDTPYETTTVDVLKPLRLCVPTNVDGGAPGAESHPDELLCYRIRGSKLAATSVALQNDLGAGTYELRKRLELCLPTVP